MEPNLQLGILMNKLMFIIILFCFIISCSLFDDPLFEYDYIININNHIVDSLVIDNPGLYEVLINSNAPVDIIFYNSYEGIDDYKNDELYSQNIYQPLFYQNATFINDEVFIYDETMIYYVIDNSDFLSYPESNAEVNIKIYFKEE